MVTPAEVETAVSAKKTDPGVDAVITGMVAADLWRHDVSVELTRDGSRVSLRVLLPEVVQGGRTHDAERAQRIRSVVAEALRADGYRGIFTDALWCERGTKGWAIIARGQQ